jgi:hypothetical protein
MSVTSAEFWSGETTVVPATLRGYRTWRVVGGDSSIRLASTAMAYVWADPAVSATCMQETTVGPVDQACPCVFCAEPVHAAPANGCGCGIYGWYDPTDGRLVDADVFGAIEVDGRVVLATHGFRAEKARVVAIAIEPPRLDPLLGRYLDMRGGVSRGQLHALAQWCVGQGIQVFTSREELVEAFPPHDVSGLVQHDCGEGCSAWRRPYNNGGAIPPPITVSATATAACLAAAGQAEPDAVAASSAYLVKLERSVAPWKRRLLASLSGVAAATCAVGTAAAILGVTQAGDSGEALLPAGLAAFNALGVFLNIQLTRRAWRWGR